MLHHKVGWCTYTRDVTFKKNMDRVFINPRTSRVPIIKVIKYQHGAASDSVSFINNHHKSTKQLFVGSIHEINQGSNPESFNLQILHHQDQWQRDYSKCHQAPRYWLSDSSFNSKFYTPWNWHFSKFQIICDEEDDDDKRKETENKLKSQSIIGGENGESWSNAGRLNNSQNCFQTFRYWHFRKK